MAPSVHNLQAFHTFSSSLCALSVARLCYKVPWIRPRVGEALWYDPATPHKTSENWVTPISVYKGLPINPTFSTFWPMPLSVVPPYTGETNRETQYAIMTAINYKYRNEGFEAAARFILALISGFRAQCRAGYTGGVVDGAITYEEQYPNEPFRFIFQTRCPDGSIPKLSPTIKPETLVPIVIKPDAGGGVIYRITVCPDGRPKVIAIEERYQPPVVDVQPKRRGKRH